MKTDDLIEGHLEKLALAWPPTQSTPVAAVGLAGQPTRNSNFSRCPEEIRSLPLEERAHLADVILKSLNQPASEMDLKWGELAVQRLSDLMTGLAQAIPRYDVFEEIWTRYP